MAIWWIHKAVAMYRVHGGARWIGPMCRCCDETLRDRVCENNKKFGQFPPCAEMIRLE